MVCIAPSLNIHPCAVADSEQGTHYPYMWGVTQNSLTGWNEIPFISSVFIFPYWFTSVSLTLSAAEFHHLSISTYPEHCWSQVSKCTVCFLPSGKDAAYSKVVNLTPFLYSFLMQEWTGSLSLSHTQLVNSGTLSPSSVIPPCCNLCFLKCNVSRHLEQSLTWLWITLAFLSIWRALRELPAFDFDHCKFFKVCWNICIVLKVCLCCFHCKIRLKACK